MASFEIKGKVLAVLPTVQVTDSVRKKELILEIDNETQYPQTIKIEAIQDKCEDQNLNEVIPGDIVTVSINLRGRVWEDQTKGKKEVFNTLAYWKMAINQTVRQPAQQQQQQAYQPQGQPQQQYVPPVQQQPQYQGYQQPAQQQGYVNAPQQTNPAMDFGGPAPTQTPGPNYAQNMPPSSDLPF